jgi:hypothetical protein
VNKEVKIHISILKDKVIKRIKSREITVNISNNIIANMSEKSDNLVVAILHESDYLVLK